MIRDLVENVTKVPFEDYVRLRRSVDKHSQISQTHLHDMKCIIIQFDENDDRALRVRVIIRYAFIWNVLQELVGQGGGNQGCRRRGALIAKVRCATCMSHRRC